MTVVVHANLDIEATWTGATLPQRVLARISAAGALLSAFGDEVWTPAPVDPARVAMRVALRTGAPPRADVAWAQAGAKAANDRRLAQRVCALPGARVATTLDELAAMPAPWVAKAPWTAAGRDRVRGPLDAETARYAARLLARHGALVVEPWCDRVLDFGVCATVDAGGVTAQAPHGLLVDARGGFLGIDLGEPALTTAERDRVEAAVHAAGAALAATGYHGPFAIDGFVWGDRQLHPVCEINARYTFGWVARALGARRLGFGAPPPGATVLVRPTDVDPTCAWLSSSGA